MDILNKKLILASQSPRRKELLEKAGFQFEIRTAPIDEDYPEDLPVESIATYLADKKAEAAKHLIAGNEILLTADSTVVLDGKQYGKPQSYEEAIQTILALAGKTHQVITGVCLLSLTKKKVFSGVSLVTMEPMNEEEANFYIDRYKPFDKAGSYGVQEWIGLCKISKIEGTYANIMGLPVDLVYEYLKEF